MPFPPKVQRAIADAKAHFAECIRQAEAGVETVLTRHGRPVARIVPCEGDGRVLTVHQTRSSDSRSSRQGAPAGDVGEIATPDATTPQPFRSERAKRQALRELLEREIWPRVPEHLRGQELTKTEREKILG
jgi:prevent-host-death family protein